MGRFDNVHMMQRKENQRLRTHKEWFHSFPRVLNNTIGNGMKRQVYFMQNFFWTNAWSFQDTPVIWTLWRCLDGGIRSQESRYLWGRGLGSEGLPGHWESSSVSERWCHAVCFWQCIGSCPLMFHAFVSVTPWLQVFEGKALPLNTTFLVLLPRAKSHQPLLRRDVSCRIRC